MTVRLQIIYSERKKRPRSNYLSLRYNPSAHELRVLLPYPVTESEALSDKGTQEFINYFLESNDIPYEKAGELIEYNSKADIQEMVDYWIDKMGVDYSGDIRWKSRKGDYARVELKTNR